jgi:hypothetical protein
VNLLIESLEADTESMIAPPLDWPAESLESLPQTERELFFAKTDSEPLIIRRPLEKPDTTIAANDWFEMALQAELPTRPVRNSWGDDDEDVEEEIPDEEVVPADDEEPDPFEELDDEYEIEPKDDGFVIGTDDPDLEPDEEDID